MSVPTGSVGGGRGPLRGWLIALLALVLLMAGCSTPERDESSDAPAAVSQAVSPDQALDLTIEGVAHLTAPPGTFATPGRVKLAPVTDPQPGVPGVSVAGAGVDVSFEGVEPGQPLHLVFTDVRDPASPEDIPAVVHQRHDGTWETEPGKVTAEGDIAIDATEFSLRVPGWLDPLGWLRDVAGSVADSVADAIGGRTDEPPCADNGPNFAEVSSGTTLVHDCLITNTDPANGRDRAEVQLSPNRRHYLWVAIPQGVEYSWVNWQPPPLRAALGRMFGFDPDRQALVDQGTLMTSGVGQPTTDQALTFTAFIDLKSSALSLAATVLGLAPDVPRIFGGKAVDPRGGLLAAALVTAQCADKIPHSRTDIGQSYAFFRCVVGAAMANLEDPDKALAAAMEQFGEASYSAQAQDALKSRATVLRVLGTVVKVLSLGGAVRDIWSQVVDSYAQMGSLRTGDVQLALRGRPNGPADGQTDPHVVRFDGIGDLTLSMNAADLTARGYINQGNMYSGMDASCVRYAKEGSQLSASVESATGRVLAIVNFGGDPQLRTQVGDIRVGSTLAQVRSAFNRPGYQVVEMLDLDFGQGSNGVVVNGPDGSIGLGLEDVSAAEYANGSATVGWVAGVGIADNAPTARETGC
jgi:hypothetical protein